MAADSDSRLIAAFLDYLKVEKGLRPLTVAAYTRDLAQFQSSVQAKRRNLIDCRRERCSRISRQALQQSSGWALGRSQAIRAAALLQVPAARPADRARPYFEYRNAAPMEGAAEIARDQRGRAIARGAGIRRYCSAAARPLHSGSFVRRWPESLRSDRHPLGRSETGAGLRDGPRQRRQGANRPAGKDVAASSDHYLAEARPSCWAIAHHGICLSVAQEKCSVGSAFGSWFGLPCRR